MNQKDTMKRSIPALLLVAALAGCATSSPDVYRRGDALRMQTIQSGTVVSVRPVLIDGGQSGVGAVSGGVVGAVAGSSIGGRRESIAFGVLGAVGGAIAGNAIERHVTREDALEIVVQLRDGSRRSIVQAPGGDTILGGDRVDIVTNGSTTRVVRAR